MAATLQPTLQSNRDYFLDVWRGFAITGVLFAYIIWNLGNLSEQQWTSADKFIGNWTGILIDGKFYTALSLLFGIGFYLQFKKSRQNQNSVVPLALRRILLKLLIGAIHALFFRQGDVLMPYALCSLYLLFARHARNKILIALIIFCFLFPPLYWEFLRWIGYKNPFSPKDTGFYMTDMLHAFIERHNPVTFFLDFGFFILFLLGFYAAKNNWLQKLSGNRKSLLIVFAAGIVFGVGMNFIMEKSYTWFGLFSKMNFSERLFSRYTWSAFYLLHTVSLAVAYMAGLYWLFLGNYKMKPLANMGRMALTNYLSQSMIMVPACFIFGLFDHFTPLKTVAWSTGIWIAQAIFCSWWLKHYNFGPFEWLLRSFTYRQRQPMKKPQQLQNNELSRMRYITPFILCCMISGTLMSQHISGKLKNFPSTQFTVSYSPDGITKKSETVYVDESGQFQHKLTMKYPAIIIVNFTDYVTQYLFLGPGLQLFFEADLRDEELFGSSIKMSGNSVRFNNYFLKLKSSERFNAFDIQQHYSSILKIGEPEFVAFTKQYLIIRDSIRKSFFEPIMMDGQAKYFVRTDSIQSQYNVMYWTIKYALSKNTTDQKVFFEKYIVPVMKPLGEPAATTGWWFRYAWQWQLSYLYEETKRKGDTAWYPAIPVERNYGMFDRMGASSEFLQSMYGGFGIPNLISNYSYIPLSRFSQYDSAFERMIAKIKDPSAERQLRAEWSVGRKKGMLMKKGEQAPDFRLIDSGGNYHRRADFKGKILVIDVWSSYCGPCIKEFPLMQRLKEKFNERKDLLFLNISIDQNRKAWIEKGLRKVSPAGMCLWAENGDDSYFCKEYFINQIPHVIVIDKQGKFIAYNAPMPSWGNDLATLITKTLSDQ